MNVRKRRICLLGASYETGNMGVSALTASLVAIFRKLVPDCEITLLISHHEATERRQRVEGSEVLVKSLPFRMSPLSLPGFSVLFVSLLSGLARIPFLRRWAVRRSPLLRLIDESDFIGDIHAGDSFSDIYGLYRFWQGCQPLLWVLRLGKPLVMLPQTYGPFYGRRARSLAGRILGGAASILSRDSESAALAARLSGREKVEVLPDVAFCLEATPHRDGYAEVPFLRSARPVLGLNISGLLYHGGYSQDNMFGLKLDYAEFSRRLAIELLERTDYDVLLVPHTVSSGPSVEDDRAVSLRVRDLVPAGRRDRVFVSERAYDQGEIKALIGECSFFIGARMHACIAALSQGIPTVGVAYSPKFRGVFGVAGVPDWVLPATELGTDEAVAFVLDRIGRADSIRGDLRARGDGLRSAVFDGFRRLVEAHDGR